MNINSHKAIKLSLILYFLSNILSLATPLDDLSTPNTLKQDQQHMHKMAADNALNIGLFTLAELFYTKFLENDTNPTTQQSIGIKLAFSLINQSKFLQAKNTIDNLPNKNAPEAILLQAIIAFQDNLKEASKLMKIITPESLPLDIQPWFYITKALIAQGNNNFKDAKNFFALARSLSTSSVLENHIDILTFRSYIFSGTASDDLAKKLKKALSKNKTTNASLTKQYAIVLDTIGNKTEAIQVLQDALEAIPFNEKNETDSFLLLIGLIAGPASEKGQSTLQEIIARKQNPNLTKMALATLTENAQNIDTQAYFNFLSTLIDSQTHHPLLSSLLIHRAQLALLIKKPEIACEDANRILDQFPGSSHTTQAQRLIAFTAWNSTPPLYRTAADKLTQLTQLAQTDKERFDLNVLIADCYFLNKDYSTAANNYLTLLNNPSNPFPKGPILFQLTLALLHANDLPNAKKNLDKFKNDPHVDPINLWRAEWNLLANMKQNGQIQEAFERIAALTKTLPEKSITHELSLRLIWLKAQLSLESGNPQETPKLVDTLLSLLNSLKPDEINDEQIDTITSYALLLKSQAFFQLDQESLALENLHTLRQSYNDSKPAILSYISEARFYSSINNPTKAQQKLIQLSDNYPNSPYIAIALYEAALNAESRGLPNTYQEALTILERLIIDYPNDPLVFHARIKQADILRKLGNFGDAQLVYENLINKYPNHKDLYLVKLALTDSLFALAINSPSSLSNVAAQYENLFDTQKLSPNLRAESGFKAGYAFLKAANLNRAQEILWLTITTLLFDPIQQTQLDQQGRYWLARSIFELAAILESLNNGQQANETYQLIISYNLPGPNLAESKIK